jgi:DNA (cytosine-5)-methyltransferase 1
VFVVGHSDWRRAAAVLFDRESLLGDSPQSEEEGQVAPTLPSRCSAGGGLGTDFDLDGGLIAGGSIAHTLRAEGFDASEDGTGRGIPLVTVETGDIAATFCAASEATNASGPKVLIAFSCKDHGADAGDLAPTLRAMEFDKSHANAGGQIAVAFGAQVESPFLDDCALPITARNGDAGMVGTSSAVRRITPVEAERLQGFPDGWTDVTYRGKPAADGPRYRSLGNSFAVPVVRWIGERIESIEEIA